MVLQSITQPSRTKAVWHVNSDYILWNTCVQSLPHFLNCVMNGLFTTATTRMWSTNLVHVCGLQVSREQLQQLIAWRSGTPLLYPQKHCQEKACLISPSNTLTFTKTDECQSKNKKFKKFPGSLLAFWDCSSKSCPNILVFLTRKQQKCCRKLLKTMFLGTSQNSCKIVDSAIKIWEMCPILSPKI